VVPGYAAQQFLERSMEAWLAWFAVPLLLKRRAHEKPAAAAVLVALQRSTCFFALAGCLLMVHVA
jgi:hypothetical protein